MKCPQCYQRMAEGYMSTGGGLNWFRRFSGSSVDFAQSIVGTFAWFRWHRVKAYRCTACELILFHYGEHARRQRARRFKEFEAQDDAAAPESVRDEQM